MEDLASWKEELAEQRSEYQLDLALRRAQRLEELEQLRKSLSELLDRHTFGQRRLLRAFPQMRSIDHKQALERLRQRQKERQEKKGGSVSVSYTHLDVYKRQLWPIQAPSINSSSCRTCPAACSAGAGTWLWGWSCAELWIWAAGAAP